MYELLTGTTPFSREQMQQAGLDEVRRIIREEEPAKPSLRLSTLGDTLPSVAAVRKLEPKRLSAFVRGDLDWIVMKALEKDRDRRYATASAFAEDLLRYLEHEPVEASPPSSVYRFRKFARRNKGTLTAGLVIALSVMTGAGVATWQAVEATRERNRAVVAERLAEKGLEGERLARSEAELQREKAMANLRNARSSVVRYFMMAQGRESERPDVYRKAVELDPGASEHVWQRLGTLAFERDEYGDSIKALRNAVRTNPKDGCNLFCINLHKLAECPDGRYRRQFAELADGVVQTSPNKYPAMGLRGVIGTALNDGTSEAYFQQAVDGGLRLSQSLQLESEQDPQRTNWFQCFELAYMLGYGSSLLQQRGDVEGAIKRRRQAAAIGMPLVEAYPEEPVHLARLIGNLTILASLERQADHTDAAFSTMKQLVPLQFERLKTTTSARDLVEQDLVNSLKDLLSLALEVRDETAVVETMEQLQEFVAEDANDANDSAWFAVRFPVNVAEATRLAVEWAEAAADHDPENSNFHNTLGVAYYRAGRFADAIEALHKSEELSSGDSLGYNAFFLAMACQQSGQPDEARQWYDKAVEWTQNRSPENTELRRFQEEAENLLSNPSSELEPQSPTRKRPPAPALPTPADEKR